MKSEIEIFRTGTHTDMNGRTITVSRDELVAMAAAYDPASHEAPIVVGHPKHNDPAMGWVKSLTVSDDGVLSAELHQVNENFSQAVDEGAFKKISASLYPPGVNGNPAGNTYGLRHVGFLGGAVPAIKGLQAVSFADDGAVASVFISGFAAGSQKPEVGSQKPEVGSQKPEVGRNTDSEPHLARQARPGARSFSAGGGDPHGGGGVPPSDKEEIRSQKSEIGSQKPEARLQTSDFRLQNPPSTKKDIGMDNDQKEKEFAEREAALKTREDAVAKQQADFAEAETARREKENLSFVETQIKAGKLASGMKDQALALMNKTDAQDMISFGEAGEKTALDIFKGMFTNARPVIDFGEHTSDDGKGGSAPETYEEFLEPALAFQAEQKQKGIEIDMARAVDHVRKGTNK